jgi:ribosomal-protein-alanine N-acetyltransferase
MGINSEPISRNSVRSSHRLLSNPWARARLNLGFAYARRVWRQGMGWEALRFWCDWGLAQPQIWRIEAFCDVENHASRALLERAGLEFEGCLRRFYRQPELEGDAPRDVLMFAQVDPSKRI